jgi:LemA protein
MIAVWIVLAILVLLVLFVIASYNGLVRARNRTDDSWSQIDVQLRRRYDLIPNLVETVKATRPTSVRRSRRSPPRGRRA